MKLLHFSDLHLGMENYGHIDPETGLSKRFSDWQRALQQIIDLAHELGLCTTAEGVETEEQYLKLKELGCDLGQGYLFASPVAPHAIAEFLEERRKGSTLIRSA